MPKRPPTPSNIQNLAAGKPAAASPLAAIRHELAAVIGPQHDRAAELAAVLGKHAVDLSGIPPRPSSEASASPRSAIVPPDRIVSAGDLGRLVRAARKRMKLSQQAFADLAGVGRRFVSELEAGKPTLEIGRVLKVAAAAGIDVLARKRAP